jgi:hypothetical protein
MLPHLDGRRRVFPAPPIGRYGEAWALNREAPPGLPRFGARCGRSRLVDSAGPYAELGDAVPAELVRAAGQQPLGIVGVALRAGNAGLGGLPSLAGIDLPRGHEGDPQPLQFQQMSVEHTNERAVHRGFPFGDAGYCPDHRTAG